MISCGKRITSDLIKYIYSCCRLLVVYIFLIYYNLIMTKSLYASVIIFSLLFVMPFASYASQLDDGIGAYKRQDYSLAYQKLLPLAEQGGGKAQYYVGDMLVGGMGVAADMGIGI